MVDRASEEIVQSEVAKLRERVALLETENKILWQTRGALAKSLNPKKKGKVTIGEHTFTLTGLIGDNGAFQCLQKAQKCVVELAGVSTTIRVDFTRERNSSSAKATASVSMLLNASEYVAVIIESCMVGKYPRSHYNPSKITDSFAEIVFLSRDKRSSKVEAIMNNHNAQNGLEVTISASVKLLRYDQSVDGEEKSDLCFASAVLVFEDEDDKHAKKKDEEEGEVKTETTKSKEIVVDVDYVSRWSEFLRAYFASNMKEKKEGKYPIKDCTATDFEELLDVIMPSSKPITRYNYDTILYLADRFIMPDLTRKCECFLVDKSRHNISDIEVIGFADHYDLEFTKAIVLDRLSTTEKIRTELPPGEDYQKFSEEMKAAIQARYFQLDCKERGIGS